MMKNAGIKSRFNKKSVVILSLLFACVVGSMKAQFVHPGVYHKKSDLDRMKYMVEAGIEPYKTTFENFSKIDQASYDYIVRKDPLNDALCREGCDNGPSASQRNSYESDALAARYNAIMWNITGDVRHAEKAIEILNAWSSLKSFYGGGTEPLSAGLYATPLVDAAEIMKHTYDGWADEDIKAFGDMLVYPGYSNTIEPTAAMSASQADQADGVTFYWSVYQGDPGRAGNQGLLAWRSVMAIGIFLDNEIIYERALRQVQGMSHRSDDFAYPSGPAILGGLSEPLTATDKDDYRHADRDFMDYIEYDDNGNPVLNDEGNFVLADDSFINVVNEHFIDWKSGGRGDTVEDWGYDDQIQYYILENGQGEENSRDPGHSSLGVGAVAEIAEIAWNQGDDIYSYLDNRILLGLEYAAKYGVSYLQSYPDQLEPWEPTVENGEYIRHNNRTGRREALKINPYVTFNYDRFIRGNAVFRPVYEMQTAHYNVRMDMADEALWINRARELSIETTGQYESGDGTDAPGWGGLVFHRPDGCAGDPVSGVTNNIPEFAIPSLPLIVDGEIAIDAVGSVTIEAENYDFFSGNAEGRTYHETTPTNVGGVYRVDNETTDKTTQDYVNEGVDVTMCSECAEGDENGYSVTEIATGEWISYTMYVPAAGEYDIKIKYASEKENGQIKFNFNGTDVTSDVSVPFGGDDSTGLTDWKELTVATGVKLEKGVQTFKTIFNGSSNAFELDNITIAFSSFGCRDGLPEDAELIDGIDYAYYRGSWNELPNFDELTPEKIGIAEKIDLLPADFREYFGLVFDGYIYIEEDGEYTFYMTSDDGAKLSIDDILLVENDGSDTGIEKSAELCLNSGFHKINVQYFDKEGGQELSLMYEGASLEKSPITKFYDNQANLARYGEASQSSTAYNGYSGLAIDGDTDGAFGNGSVTHTNNGVLGDGSEKWWQVDLKAEYILNQIKIYNRTGGYEERLGNYKVEVLDENEEVIFSVFPEGYPDPSVSIDLDNVQGRYVKVSKTSDYGLTLAEVEVYGGVPVDLDRGKVGLEDMVMGPNPVEDVLTVDYIDGATVKLYDMIGQLALSTVVEGEEYSVDMGTLPTGIYIVKITRDGETIEEKLIKQ